MGFASELIDSEVAYQPHDFGSCGDLNELEFDDQRLPEFNLEGILSEDFGSLTFEAGELNRDSPIFGRDVVKEHSCRAPLSYAPCGGSFIPKVHERPLEVDFKDHNFDESDYLNDELKEDDLAIYSDIFSDFASSVESFKCEVKANESFMGSRNAPSQCAKPFFNYVENGTSKGMEKLVVPQAPQVLSKKMKHPKGWRSNSITLKVLEKHYSKSLVETSKSVGLSVTMLKKACRRFGIRRWPHRKLACIDRMIVKTKSSLAELEGKSVANQIQGEMTIETLQQQIKILEAKRLAVCQATSRGMDPLRCSSDRSATHHEPKNSEKTAKFFACLKNASVPKGTKETAYQLMLQYIKLAPSYAERKKVHGSNICLLPEEPKNNKRRRNMSLSEASDEEKRRKISCRYLSLTNELGKDSPYEQLLRMKEHINNVLLGDFTSEALDIGYKTLESSAL
mmetsp:Transcript_19228/g.28381  ORF Transcript_19228/g.28381 Transcript_19228/m.28381 type:complete len:452 (+) Transcript_19228:156-1511(+)